MQNIFKDVRDKELVEIYKDYLGSQELGVYVKSFKDYSIQLSKESHMAFVSMGDCINIVTRMFFEEVAIRFCRFVEEIELRSDT